MFSRPSPAQQSHADQCYNRLIAEVMVLLQKDQYLEALGILKKIVNINECSFKKSDIFLKIGFCYLELEDLKQAQTYLNKAVQDSAWHASAWDNRATLFEKLAEKEDKSKKIHLYRKHIQQAIGNTEYFLMTDLDQTSRSQYIGNLLYKGNLLFKLLDESSPQTSWEEVRDNLQYAIAEAEKIQSRLAVDSSDYHNLLSTLKHLGQYQVCIQSYQAAITFLKASSDPSAAEELQKLLEHQPMIDALVGLTDTYIPSPPKPLPIMPQEPPKTSSIADVQRAHRQGRFWQALIHWQHLHQVLSAQAQPNPKDTPFPLLESFLLPWTRALLSSKDSSMPSMTPGRLSEYLSSIFFAVCTPPTATRACPPTIKPDLLKTQDIQHPAFDPSLRILLQLANLFFALKYDPLETQEPLNAVLQSLTSYLQTAQDYEMHQLFLVLRTACAPFNLITDINCDGITPSRPEPLEAALRSYRIQSVFIEQAPLIHSVLARLMHLALFFHRFRASTEKDFSPTESVFVTYPSCCPEFLVGWSQFQLFIPNLLCKAKSGMGERSVLKNNTWSYEPHYYPDRFEEYYLYQKSLAATTVALLHNSASGILESAKPTLNYIYDSLGVFMAIVTPHDLSMNHALERFRVMIEYQDPQNVIPIIEEAINLGELSQADPFYPPSMLLALDYVASTPFDNEFNPKYATKIRLNIEHILKSDICKNIIDVRKKILNSIGKKIESSKSHFLYKSIFSYTHYTAQHTLPSEGKCTLS